MSMLKHVSKLAKASLLYLIHSAVLAVGLSDSSPDSALSYQQLLSRNEIRIAVPYDPTIYIDAKGKPTGISVQISKYFGLWLSENYQRKISVKLIPTLSEKLIDALDSGEADIALGYLEQYKNRLESPIYLSQSHAEHQSQVLVSALNSPIVRSADELSGKLIFLGRQVRSAALIKLNDKLIQEGRPPVILNKDHVGLDDEEMLQMVNDGLIPYVMGTEFRVELWKPYLTNIKVYKDIRFDISGNIGWAIRSRDKGLMEDIVTFSSSPLNTEALKIYGQVAFGTSKSGLKDPKGKEEWTRFISMRPIFEKYGNQYHLDPLLLASFGFQETMLNQALISPGGAIGVMQLNAATGNVMNVGNIHELDANIHAGTKYLNTLLSDTFNKDGLDNSNRTLFAIASYNLGPNNVAKARNEAAKRGFDPNKWFLNVEMACAALFGTAPMNYVRNIYKYYVIYQLSLNPALSKSFDKIDKLVQ